MKILLIQPVEFRKGFLDAFFLFSPLPLETVAGSLSRHHDIRILDLRLQDNPEQSLNSALEEFCPDIVAATSLTLNAHSAFESLKRAKLFNPEITTIIGGQHVSLNPQTFESPYVDVIVIGEGDRALNEIIQTIETSGHSGLGTIQGIAYRNNDSLKYTEPRALTEKLDELQFPARELTKKDQEQYALLNKRKWLFIESARGCPFRCEFCAVWRLHQGRCRFKSPERTVAEIENVADRVETVFFADDNFFVDLDRAHKIARLLADREIRLRYYVQARPDTIASNARLVDAWKDIGLEGVYLGFEECNSEKMKTIGASKATGYNSSSVDVLRERSIFALGSFIVSPEYDTDDFSRLKQHVAELNASMLTFYVLTPYPGTKLYDRTKDSLVSRDYRLYDGIHAVLPTTLDREGFYHEFTSLFEHFWRRKDKGHLLWNMPPGPALHWYKCLKHLNRDHHELEESFCGVPWVQKGV